MDARWGIGVLELRPDTCLSNVSISNPAVEFNRRAGRWRQLRRESPPADALCESPGLSLPFMVPFV